jgi:beta-glucanase (GH16 family)
MLPSFPTVSWPYSGELDILELSYRDQNVFYAGTLHHSGAPIGASYDYSNNTSYFDDFHLYTLEWDRASIKWYVDDVLVNTITRSSNATLDNNWPFDKEFHLILNSAVGGTLGGTPDFGGQPQYMMVDYVKVYQKIMD